MIAFLLVFVSLGRLYRDMLKKPETRGLLLIACAILGVGLVFYTNVEGWSLLDALYFCVVTLGTVGFGDITPKTNAGKLFTIIYIIMGLGVIGGLFATVGNTLDTNLLAGRGVFGRQARNEAGPAATDAQPKLDGAREGADPSTSVNNPG